MLIFFQLKKNCLYFKKKKKKKNAKFFRLQKIVIAIKILKE